MEKVLVLSADPWSMEDEQRPGQKREGATLYYLAGYREPGSNGLRPIKVSCSTDVYARLSGVALPAWGEISMGSRPGQGGKAALVVTDVKVGKALDVSALFKPEAVGKSSATA